MSELQQISKKGSIEYDNFKQVCIENETTKKENISLKVQNKIFNLISNKAKHFSLKMQHLIDKQNILNK